MKRYTELFKDAMNAKTLDEMKYRLSELYSYAYNIESKAELIQIMAWGMNGVFIRELIQEPNGLELAKKAQQNTTKLVDEINHLIQKYEE